MKKQVELITFIVFFSGLRSYAGGYHAKTHIECISLSLCLFLISALSSTYFIEYGKIILFSGVLFSIIMVFVLAPTESENKPLSKRHKKNKTLSRIIVIALSVTAICLYLAKETTGHVYITAAAVAMSFSSH